MAMVDMDILIPTFGRHEIINDTLLLLLKQNTIPNSVIVVNQTKGIYSPKPEVCQAYNKTGLKLVWLNLERPNVMAAQNAGLLASSSEFCLILDDDIIPPPDLVKKHWERHHDGKGWVAVGGQVWHRLPHTAIESLSLAAPDKGTSPHFPNREKMLIPGEVLLGGNWSFRRKTIVDLGGWDESFVGSANYQELDNVNRFKNEGFPFVVDLSIWLIHLRAPSGGCRIPGNKLFPEWTKSTNFFLYKYRYPQDLPWKNILIMALRAGPLRRENAMRPLRWPEAWAGFLKGWWMGREKAHNPIYPLLAKNGSSTPSSQN